MLAAAIRLIPMTDSDFRPPTTPLDQFANAELGIGAFLIIAFTVFYGLRFRWWKTINGKVNFAGIAVFSIFLSLSLLLAYSVITRLLTHGDYIFRDVLRAIVYLVLPASGAFMFVALFKSRDQLLKELRANQRGHEPETPADPILDREA